MTTAQHIKKITDDNFSQTVKSGVTLIDLYAEWCGPCRMMSPILEKVAATMHGKAVVGKLDIDAEPKTAALLQVTSVPTLVLFKDGKEVDRLIGLRDANAIQQFISSAL